MYVCVYIHSPVEIEKSIHAMLLQQYICFSIYEHIVNSKGLFEMRKVVSGARC